MKIYKKNCCEKGRKTNHQKYNDEDRNGNDFGRMLCFILLGVAYIWGAILTSMYLGTLL